jgi:hypothetical protein
MSKHLEQFVQDNREEFDKFEPGPVVWHNIQQQLKKKPEKKGVMISMTAIRWSAAAAIILLLGAGAYLFIQQKTPPPLAAVTKKTVPVTNELPVVGPKDSPVNGQTPSVNSPAEQRPSAIDNQLAKAPDPESEELYHYTRLVELKQEEIKKIQKDEPLLYRQFAGDINKLDSSFHTLKKQLPVNPNREQILEAMIQNLQLQESILNRQLSIIKQINHVKKTEYEKAIKSS